jgi:phage regulator Rha-like protein
MNLLPATLVSPNVPLTMTSREIAELTGKKHADVTRDIRNMLAALEIDVSNFAAMSPDSYGRAQPIFNLPKDLTITLVSGYSVPMRHKIVTRWMELEAAKPVAKDPK